MKKIKKGQIASWGTHTDENGIVSRVKKDGFYARYKSRIIRNGKSIYLSKFFTNENIVDHPVNDRTNFPPSGNVQIRE